jgi:hypothetical protein
MALLKPVELDGEAPEFAAFQKRMWTGEANIVGSDAKLLYVWAGSSGRIAAEYAWAAVSGSVEDTA